MPNNLFNKFGNIGNRVGGSGNILSHILDIMLQNGKINQKQYADLQQYKNNPEAVVNYLINNGRGNEISQAQQLANQLNNFGK